MSGKAVYVRIKQLFEEIRSERIKKAARKSGELRSRTRERIMPLHDILTFILAKKGLSAATEGNLPNDKEKLVSAWIILHKDELLADWELTQNGELPYNIDPLK
jgi:hypothetical protein